MSNQLPEGTPIDPRLEDVRAQVTDLLAAAAQMQRRTSGDWSGPLEEGGRPLWNGPAEPIDFSDFLASVLRDVADRVGGVDTLISGRPGSWESEHVAALAQSFN